jgi:cell division protease FtsH
MARRMVTAFGMSDVIGLVAVADPEQEVFLGREITQRRVVSEHTQRIVDEEIKRILDQAHKRAHVVLKAHADLLERIARALLERETLGREEIQMLERGDTLPPPPVEPIPLDEPRAERPALPGRAPRPFGLPGGEGPLPGPAPGVIDVIDPVDDEPS